MSTKLSITYMIVSHAAMHSIEIVPLRVEKTFKFATSTEWNRLDKRI